MAEIAIDGMPAPVKAASLRTVVAASATGATFERYDFFVFGSLTQVISKTFFSGLNETADERRLRHAACLLGDIGWRAHPDYRGEQSMNIIAHGAFVSIDHPGRAYLALSVYFRHAGLSEEELSPRLRELATTRMLDRARVLGAAMRVAYILTAGQSGVQWGYRLLLL